MIKNDDTYELLKWMAQMGFKHKSKMKVHTFQETGRGLLSCESISANQTIISIPASLMITRSMIQNSDFYQHFLTSRPINYFTEIELLALFVSCESLRGQKSKWWNYLRTLPKIQMTLTNLKEEGLKNLPKSYSKLVKEEINKIGNFYSKTGPFVEYAEKMDDRLKGKLTFETFHRSWNIVNSRCVSLMCQNTSLIQSDKSYPNKNTIALMPFLDLLNHSTDAKVSTSLCQATNSFEIVTLKRVRKRRQVFINYGDHGNRKLLLYYGFIVINNPNNVVSLAIEDLQFVKGCHAKCTFLKTNYVRENIDNLGVTKDGLSWSLKVVIEFLSSNYCFLRFQNPSQALYKLYSSSVINIEEQLSNTEIFLKTAYQLLTRMIRESNCTKVEFVDNRELEPIANLLKKLLEEETSSLAIVQKHYEKRIKI